MSSPGLLRVLVVEDNPDTRLLMDHLLDGHCDASMAGRFDEALEAANQQSFDLFLFDINLGENRSGIDLLRLLREKPEYASTPAIALTAYALPGDRDHFLQSGFEGYLSKPFTREALLEVVERYSGRTS